MAKPHVIIVPFPVQGHVIPLMELAQHLAGHGIKVTFVNIEIVHDRIIQALPEKEALDGRIRLVSVPDGLEPQERYIPGKLTETLYKEMPKKIEELTREINASPDSEKVTCIVYDQMLGQIQEVAENMGVGSAAFCPAAAALLTMGFNIPKLIEDGIIDDDGTPLKNDAIQFAPIMPVMRPSDFVWVRTKLLKIKRSIFSIMAENNKVIESADWLICNSAHDLEPGAFTAAQKIAPIGPLLASSRLGYTAGHFHKQDADCLEWLDQQPLQSVIYVAFGSSTMFSTSQFQELALGLEQNNRPFLWVVRPDTISGSTATQYFPDGFLERVSTRGRIVQWAPQQKVLSHPSIACFVSHCGWNSTLESVTNGVPLLCWPYIADQFINRTYICDVWKVGLPLEEDENGVVKAHEIKKQIDRLLNEDAFKERSSQLKETILSSVKEGGNSYKNLTKFISWIKESY